MRFQMFFLPGQPVNYSHCRLSPDGLSMLRYYISRGSTGISITELGIPWYHDPHSKVKVFRDSFQMLVDLIRIRINNICGKYAKKV